MYGITFQNNNGDILDCDGTRYDLISCEGLSCPSAEITYTELAGHDGGIFNSKRLEKRNLVPTIKIHNPAQANRINLYNFFQAGAEIRVNYKSDYRDCYITGRIESFEPDIFSVNEEVNISILCGDPYWKAAKTEEIILSHATGLFHFPFYKDEDDDTTIVFGEMTEDMTNYIVNNDGVDVGMIITIKNSLKDDTNNIKITNETTGDFLALNYTMSAGESIVINTRSGEKSITSISSDGTETNIINAIGKDSSFIYLTTGANELSFTCSDYDEVGVAIEVLKLYQGV